MGDHSNLPEEINTDTNNYHNENACELCDKKFGMKNKRHHCRKCNKSVC